jgi:transposase-like protein
LVKIRHYGFLSSTWKRQKLKLLQEKLQVKVLERVEKKPFLPKCPCCKAGNLHRIAVFDQRGPPAWYLCGSQSSVPVKTNLRVRVLMPKSEGKHNKTNLKLIQKKEAYLPLDILSNFFTISA